MGPQEKDLLGGVEIVVATPGRLLDHAGSRTLNLGQVEVLVLDEGDRMLDMGFIDDIRRILALLPAQASEPALLGHPRRRGALPREHLPARARASVDVAPTISAAESVEQIAYLVDADRKRELLAHLVRTRDLRQVLVFTRTKQMTRRLASQLDRDGVEATAIHGDRTQPERERALEQFKSGEVRVLVATDVAARGLDIEALPVVVNFEIPYDPEDYVHRIGRTGRAGMEGIAISLVSFDEEDQLRSINRLLKRDLPVRQVRGFEVDPRIAAHHREPAQRTQAFEWSRRGRSGASGAPGPAARRVSAALTSSAAYGCLACEGADADIAFHVIGDLGEMTSQQVLLVIETGCEVTDALELGRLRPAVRDQPTQIGLPRRRGRGRRRRRDVLVEGLPERHQEVALMHATGSPRWRRA